MIDTAEHFSSKIKVPPLLAGLRKSGTETADRGRGKSPASPAESVKPKAEAKEYAAQYRGRSELLLAIDNFYAREAAIARQIKKERLEIQRLKMENDSLGLLLRELKAKKEKEITPPDSTVAPVSKPPDSTPPAPGPKGAGRMEF